MEFPVLIQPSAGNGFRASCSEPFPAAVERPTREAALEGLRLLLQERMRSGFECVKLRVDIEPTTKPVWPDDEITRNWLAEIEKARAESNGAVAP